MDISESRSGDFLIHSATSRQSLSETLKMPIALASPARGFMVQGAISYVTPHRTKDVVISAEFFDETGTLMKDICDGLIWSDEIGYFFYPLAVMGGIGFERIFVTRKPVHSIVLRVVPWRDEARNGCFVNSLEVKSAADPFDFAENIRSSFYTSSFSWILDCLFGSEPAATARALDIGHSGTDVAVTTEWLAKRFSKSGGVDCTTLDTSSTWPDHRIFVDNANVLTGNLEALSKTHSYALAVLFPHLLDKSALPEVVEKIERVLAHDGYLVLALPIGVTRWELARELNRAISGFEIIVSVPMMDPAISGTSGAWIVARKQYLCHDLNLRNMLRQADWAGIANYVAPEFSKPEPNPQLVEALAPWADVFAKEAPELNRQNRYDEAINCRLAAAILAPASEAYACELIAALRSTGEMEAAERFFGIALQNHPESWGVRLQGAFIYSLTDRGDMAISIASEYVQSIKGKFNTSMRRSISTLMRNFAHECQRAGVRTDNAQPLLIPEVATTYNADLEANTERWFKNSLADLLALDARQRAFSRASVHASQIGIDNASDIPTKDDDTESMGDLTVDEVEAPRKTRILMVSNGSWRFLTKQLKSMEVLGSEFDVRTFDFSFQEEEIRKHHLHEIFAPVSLGLDRKAVWARVTKSDRVFRELVDWCDIVLCEWAGVPAIWLSRFLPEEKRLMIRLHSYEAFSQWPFFIDYGGVDGMIFVADHIRKFADMQFRISDYPVKIKVLPNFNDLHDFPRPKTAGASRNLAMLGYSNRNKDPLFGLKIIHKLRESDSNWYLLLIGHPWDEDSLPPEELAYYQDFMAYLNEHNLEDAVKFKPYSNQVPETLEDVGFVLSCSWREGTHEAVLEGMASGALPVIRRWPMVRVFGAPETTYPEQQYFDTVEEAVAIIRAHETPQKFKEGAKNAIAYAEARFSQEAVYPEFVNFVKTMVEVEPK